MNLAKYHYSTNENYLDYEFKSTGPKGVIRKVVRFAEMGKGIYNLGFGDLDETSGEISDSVATNNADTEKVIATVAFIAQNFSEKYPDALIAIQGTTVSRTRLYQINIAKYWDEVSKTFEIQGYRNNQWELFRKGVSYEAFTARRY